MLSRKAGRTNRGHLHIRTNRYNALITIEPADGAWKITGMDVRAEERIDPSVAAAASP